MPVTLKIPDGGGGGLRLRSGFRGPVRGAAGRRRAMREIGERDRKLEALMHTSLACTCLWSLFWIQFVIGWMFDLPALHVISRGSWPPPPVEFYIPGAFPLPFSMAGNFVLISLSGAVLAMVGVCLWTRGVKGRWRMRLAVLVFAAFPCGWALAGMAAEDAAWDGLERARVKATEEFLMSSDMQNRGLLRQRIETIDGLLEKRAE